MNRRTDTGMQRDKSTGKRERQTSREARRDTEAQRDTERAPFTV